MIATQGQSYAKRRPLLRPAQRRHVRVVLCDEAFRHTLSRERLLADRHHRCFSLVVFRLPAGSLRPATDPRVVGILAQRARLTDDVGWLGRSGIGILLRETEAEGAFQFCGRVVAELAEIGADAAWRVIRYPEGTSPAGREATSSTESSSRSRSPDDRRSPNEREDDEPPDWPASPAEDIPRMISCPLPAWKRVADVVGAVAGLILLAPIIGVVDVLIKWTSSVLGLFWQKLRTINTGTGIGARPCLISPSR